MHRQPNPQRLQFLALLALLGLSTSVFTSPVIAQKRRPLFGQVLQSDGKPLAQATVTLIEDDPGMIGVDPVDVQTTTTDERGRFVANALPGVRYSAFASGPEREGRAALAEPVQDLWCGRRVELRARKHGRRRTVQLPLPELRRWAQPEKLLVRLSFAGCPGYHIDCAITAMGTIDVPASHAIATARLHETDGTRLGDMWIRAGGKVVVPDCQRLPIRVVDDRGQPLAGALVAIERTTRTSAFFGASTHSAVRYDQCRTDAQGRATLRCALWQDPFAQGPDTLVAIATKAGYEEGASGWLNQELFVDWTGTSMQQRATAQQQRTLSIQMQAKAGTAKDLPATLGAEPRLAGKHSRLLAMANVTHKQQGFAAQHFLMRDYAIPFDADGRASTPNITATAGRLMLKLPLVDGQRVLMLPTTYPALPTCDLSRCEPLRLHLRNERGGPANEASVLLVARDASTLSFWSAAPLVPNQAGHLDLLVERGDWSLIAMDQTGWISQELTDWSGDQPLDLQFVAKPSQRVRCLDAAGQPVADARFEPGACRMLRPPTPGVPNALYNLGRNLLGLQVRQAKTDPDGFATLRFLPWATHRIEVFAWLGDHRTRSDDAVIKPVDEVMEMRLRR